MLVVLSVVPFIAAAVLALLINALLPSLAARGFLVHLRHLRPGVLPPLACLKGSHAPPRGAAVDPHASAPSGPVGSLVRLGYLTLDYLLGQALVVRRELTRQGSVSIFDRYAYDIALDPRRFRIALPGWVVNCATRMVPAPDLRHYTLFARELYGQADKLP